MEQATYIRYRVTQHKFISKKFRVYIDLLLKSYEKSVFVATVNHKVLILARLITILAF